MFFDWIQYSKSNSSGLIVQRNAVSRTSGRKVSYKTVKESFEFERSRPGATQFRIISSSTGRPNLATESFGSSYSPPPTTQRPKPKRKLRSIKVATYATNSSHAISVREKLRPNCAVPFGVAVHDTRVFALQFISLVYVKRKTIPPRISRFNRQKNQLTPFK